MATALELPTVETRCEKSSASFGRCLHELRRRLRIELLLELAADAASFSRRRRLFLVFLDWWFRFSVPVRVVL